MWWPGVLAGGLVLGGLALLWWRGVRPVHRHDENSGDRVSGYPSAHIASMWDRQ